MANTLTAGDLTDTALAKARWGSGSEPHSPHIWEGEYAQPFVRDLAKLGISQWADVAHPYTRRWLTWAEVRSKFRAPAHLEDAYADICRAIDAAAYAHPWWTDPTRDRRSHDASATTPPHTGHEYTYDRIIAARRTAACFGGTEYLMQWSDGTRTWATEQDLLWRDPKQKQMRDHNAAARKREREEMLSKSALRKDMEHARTCERRHHDLRSALDAADGGAGWLDRALNGPATCPHTQRAMQQLGDVLHGHVEQTNRDLGRAAMDTNAAELPVDYTTVRTLSRDLPQRTLDVNNSKLESLSTRRLQECHG